jgi:hypothetical protein
MLHMAKSLKYKRYTVNAPLNLAEIIDQRIVEIPYASESAYFIALAIYDCWSRREHKLTATLMALPPSVRDSVIDELCETFKNGGSQKTASWFDNRITNLVQAKILEAASRNGNEQN